MLFGDILDQLSKSISPDFQRLFQIGLERQYHPGDLLLWHINGSYNAQIAESNLKINPHMIGPGLEGFSERSHFHFIDSGYTIL